MTKTGRNEPCPCGSTGVNSLPIKYKRCCALKNEAPAKAEARMTISRKDLIGGPYTECPKCHKNTFGVFISAGGGNGYSKECTTCWHNARFSLPRIKKYIIYLDQFVFDNIVKSLDGSHPKHEAAIKDPFWIELYKKLEAVSRAQLVICPDSFFHREEAAPTGYFASMQRIYEHFSSGITFYNHDLITRLQVCEHFRNWLDGRPEVEPVTLPESIVHGDKLHEWRGGMTISVNSKPRADQIKETQESKGRLYQAFLEVFERWKTEKGRKLEDWAREETGGFAKGTIAAIKKFYERRATLPERYLQGEPLDLNDVLPPSSLELMQGMELVARQRGITDQKAALEKIMEYLFSDNLDYVPIIRIGSLLYGAIADQAANQSRTRPPSPGVMVDVNMISSLLPYCAAIFVDKENQAFLEDGRVKSALGTQARVFSLRNKAEFLQYLDEILMGMTDEHLSFVEGYYGKDWAKPYMTILDDERKKSGKSF